MENWNLNKIKEIQVINPQTGYLTIMNPWLYLSRCGWDKYDYDKQMLKYYAGALVGNELYVMEELSKNIQLLLGTMASMASLYTKDGKKPLLNPMMVKITIDYFSFAPTSKTKQQDTRSKIDKIKKYQTQEEAKNDSPININGNNIQ